MSNPTPTKQVTDVLRRVRSWFVALGVPARVLLVSTTVIALGLCALLVVTETRVTYAPLFTQLQRDDAAGMVDKLRELKVPFRLSSDGTAIEVPVAQVAETRLALASAGLPRGGGVGMEGFDHLRLGATELEQRVLYHRALEGELSRSIATISDVQAARVHLVFQERSVFVSRSEPSSASILLTLRPGARLDRGQVNGIVHLVSAAVPGLDDNRVALMTSTGLILHRPRDASDTSTGANDSEDDPGMQAQLLQSSVEERVRAMLERVVGPDHVDVRASVEIDMARVEHTEDHYDPEKTTLRSEEALTERVNPPANATVAGIPGAQSNLPGGPAAPTPTTATGPGVTRETHTRNFEVDRVTERRVMTQGALRRLAVAVVLDGVTQTTNGHTTVEPRSQSEIDQITSLVRGAVGYNEARGDTVTVQCVTFLSSMPVAAVARAPIHHAAARRAWTRYLPAAGAAVALLLVAGIVTATRRRRDSIVHDAEELSSEQLDAPRTRSAVSLPEPMPETPEELRVAALGRAANDPATAALVLRFWLGADPADRVGAEMPMSSAA